MQTVRTYAAAVLCILAISAPAQPAGAGSVLPRTAGSDQSALDWDTAFADRSGNLPVHFVATYTDERGTHRLEEWRVGRSHLRRLTDERIDLHADSIRNAGAGQQLEYIWQILDLKTKIDHRITTHGMLRLGMLYSYYSMAHVLSRPAGAFTVQALPLSGPARWQSERTTWYMIEAEGQPTLRVCWLAGVGLPLRIETLVGSTWHVTFSIQSLETRPFSSAHFTVNTDGFQVRNIDEAEAED